jgi:hypothetical protein
MAFYNSVDDASNFVISFTANPRHDFGVYAKGYYRAASNLAEHLLAKRQFPDYEAYPIVFLYRQSLELYLKGILYKAAILYAFKDIDGMDDHLRNSHRLVPLAQGATQVFKRLFPGDQALLRKAAKIELVSSEFEEIDQDSYSYRYPIDKQGNASTKPHQIVNLSALHKALNEVLEGIDTIDFGMDVEESKAQGIYEVLEEVQNFLSERA